MSPPKIEKNKEQGKTENSNSRNHEKRKRPAVMSDFATDTHEKKKKLKQSSTETNQYVFLPILL